MSSNSPSHNPFKEVNVESPGDLYVNPPEYETISTAGFEQIKVNQIEQDIFDTIGRIMNRVPEQVASTAIFGINPKSQDSKQLEHVRRNLTETHRHIFEALPAEIILLLERIQLFDIGINRDLQYLGDLATVLEAFRTCSMIIIEGDKNYGIVPHEGATGKGILQPCPFLIRMNARKYDVEDREVQIKRYLERERLEFQGLNESQRPHDYNVKINGEFSAPGKDWRIKVTKIPDLTRAREK